MGHNSPIGWMDTVHTLDEHLDNEPNLIERILSRRRLAGTVAAVMFCFVVLIAFLIPKRYRADLKILLKNESVNAIVNADDRAEGLYYLDQVGDARLNTETELMSSPELLASVAVKTGLADKESARSAQKRVDLAVKHLQENLSIAPVRRSNIIAASYSARDPKQAELVLKTLMDDYIQFHLRMHSAPQAASIFRQMADGYSRERDLAQAKLDDFKKQHEISSLPDEKAIALQRIGDLTRQLSDVQVAIKRNQNAGNRLESFIGSTPVVVEKERRSLPNQLEIQQLNMSLVTLQSKRVEAAARYQPTDRVIHDLDEQIRLTREALTKAQASNTEEISTERNTLHVAAQSDYMRTETELAGLTHQSHEVEKQLRLQQKRLNTLEDETALYNTLTQAVSRFSDLNQTYEKKAADSQLGELLDQKRVANVAVVEEPREPLSASSPRRGLILAVGFVWSILLGAIVALVADLITRRVRSPYDAELALEAPVIALLSDAGGVPSYSEANAAVYRALQRSSQPVWRLT
jgi:uncharacterized protein involved in exopolysaccharide biosynthesis